MKKFSKFLAESYGPSDADLDAIEQEEHNHKEIEFKEFDANYFKHGDKKKDCVIRALCVATHAGYRTLTKAFGKKFILGVGYASNTGISMEEIDKFAKKTKLIKLVWGDENYSSTLDKYGVTSDDTLQSFVDNQIDGIIKQNKLKYKRFVIAVRDDNKKEGEAHHYHMTPLIFRNGHWECWDLDTIENIQESIPLRCYAVQHVIGKDSEICYTNEKERVRQEQIDLLKKSRKNKQ